MTIDRLLPTLAALSALALVACQQAQPKGEEPGTIEQSIEESIETAKSAERRDRHIPAAAPPPAVLESLLPPLHVDLGTGTGGDPRFDITVNEMTAPEFFMGLVHETPYSMTVAPGVTGNISLTLKNVTIEEVLEVVRDTYGYEFQHTRHGFQVLPIRLRTRIFHVNHLNVIRSGQSGTLVSGGRQEQGGGGGTGGLTGGGGGQSAGSVKGTSITTRQPEGDFWSELENSIAAIIGLGDQTGEEAAAEPAGFGALPGEAGLQEDPLAALAGLTPAAAEPAARPATTQRVTSGNGRSVAVNPHTGLVVVRAMPLELREVETFLRETQSTIGRQVILEAKILEVELNDRFRSGIDWAGLNRSGDGFVVGGQTNGVAGNVLRNPYTGEFIPFGAPTGSYSSGSDISNATSGDSSITAGTTSFSQSSNSTSSASSNYTGSYSAALSPGLGSNIGVGGIFSLALRFQNFAAFIDLLKTQGNVHVLSSPRVSTVNNQKAVIKVGSDEYFVTSVTSNTDEAGNVTPEIELEPFFSGVALDVTPQVSSDGRVTLHIHPTVVEVVDQTKTFTVFNQQQTLPLAFSSTRESDSIVHAVNGQVVVIGGLLKEVSQRSRRSTPVLGDIPVVGEAFSHRDDQTIKSELVILLRPIVVGDAGQWTESLRDTRRSFKRLRREAP